MNPPLSVMKNRVPHLIKALAPLVVLTLILACPQSLLSQSMTEEMMAKESQARTLENDIAGLEARLAAVQKDWVTISIRLEDVQARIMDCYLEIDQARVDLEKARLSFNRELRLLYVRGRSDVVVDILTARDVTDLLVKYEYLSKIALQDSERFNRLQERSRKLEERQAKLENFKKEEVRLARNTGTTGIEVELALKRRQLADLSAQVIAMQLPATRAPAPTSFDPGRIYSMPDESSFNRTGQEFSGYSSWYGDDVYGKATAGGEVFDKYAFSCAHNTLPFGTWLRVTFKDRSVMVKVNDRGPLVPGRILDLSRGAAEAIGLTGVQWVDCEIVVLKG